MTLNRPYNPFSLILALLLEGGQDEFQDKGLFQQQSPFAFEESFFCFNAGYGDRQFERPCTF